MASFLQQAHSDGLANLTLKEFDLEISPEHDLTRLSIWEDIWKTLKEGEWHLIVSPPCNTFSRARFHYQEMPGPRPLRNVNWPRGFPWLSQHHKAIVDEANMFVDHCIEACKVCHAAGGKFIIEHPEDLGLVKGERPGSIWQWTEVLELIPNCDACTFAIQQCHFGAITPKPTRFLGTFVVTDKRCHMGLPRFDKLGAYKGPLPKSCGHVHTHKLLGKTANKWNTSPSASYPAALCKFLANLVLYAGASCGGGLKDHSKNSQSGAAVGSSSAITTPKVSGSSPRLPPVDVVDLTDGDTRSSADRPSGSVAAAAAAATVTTCGAAVTAVTATDTACGAAYALDGSGGTAGDKVQEEQFDMDKCCNHGHPIKVEWDGKVHDLVDGFGLCSPTRWQPKARGHRRPSHMKKLAADTFGFLQSAVRETFQDVRTSAFKLVTGKMQSSPFSEALLEKVRSQIACLLRDPDDARRCDEGQPFHLRLLAQWLGVFEDPDVKCLVDAEDSFAAGVNVGVEYPLPRTPQVFPPKVKHRRLDDTEFNPIAENYISGQLSSKELEAKFREEELLGRMEPSKMTVLKAKFGDKLRVASMAAIVKPDGGVRPLHDATHSVRVNHAIQYRDQLQCPGPAEVAALVREAVESREAPFCVSADIRAAHRLVKIRKEDWPYICCRADSLSETVWINKTGTFGVSSAPYWWSKLFAAVGRFVGHVMQASPFWHLVYVDDLHGAFVGGSKFELLWIWLLAFEVIGTPFGYHKFKGGFSSDFVGFHLRYDRNEVGITVKRGQWLVSWISALEEKRFVVAAREFSEFLGRLGFVAQLLTWLKPHLAPLFAWGAAVSPGMVGRLPDTVILTLSYILAELSSESFMVSAKRPLYFEVEQFRTDAKCTDEYVILGGWELESMRWFSLRLGEEQVPFLFKPNGGGAQWASTSAELLASLLALHAFDWLTPSSMRRTVALSLNAGTDNMANDSLTTKRSTTKWPLMLINMQLSSALSRARLSLNLRWRPREENTEADNLTNEVFDGFDPALRVNIQFADLDLSLVQALWKTKQQFDAAKVEAKQLAVSGEIVKKRKLDKTPW